MHNYTIIAIVLAALGFALLFLLDTLISPDTQQEMLKTVRQQHMLIGGGIIAGAYYMYTLGEGKMQGTMLKDSTPSDLPSYDDATSEVLKL